MFQEAVPFPFFSRTIESNGLPVVIPPPVDA
jgi:hypothetical protein